MSKCPKDSIYSTGTYNLTTGTKGVQKKITNCHTLLELTGTLRYFILEENKRIFCFINKIEDSDPKTGYN